MPAFADDKILGPQAIRLIADWMRGEWYEAPETTGATASTQR